MTARVGIYVRAAVDRTGGQLLDRQEQACRQLAERLGWTIVDVYRETGAGRSTARPEYQRLLADARHGRIDTIVADDHDRLGRTPETLEPALQFARVVTAAESTPNQASDPVAG